MGALTREAIARVLGPVDETLAAELVGTEASEQELLEAKAWLLNDDALINDLRPLPDGRVAELIEILQSLDQQPEEEP